jgi:predicted ATPase
LPISANQCNDRLFVITGGPGVGKTAVLDELQRGGFACVPEAARRIIQEQVRSGGDAVPWLNMERYSALMLEESIKDYLTHAGAASVTFFDRGILDTVTHFRLAGLPLPDEAYRLTQRYRYNPDVFLFPPWQEIYQTDSERKQTFEESVTTYRVNKEVYSEYGYRLLEVPVASVTERVDFILRSVSSN